MRGRLALLFVAQLACSDKALSLGDNEPDPTPMPANVEQLRAAEHRIDPVLTTTQEFMQRLGGRWRRCNEGGSGILHFQALEFVPKRDAPSLEDFGDWFALKADASRNEVRATDRAERGSFRVIPPVSVTVVFKNGAQGQITVLFEDGGRRLRVVRDAFDPIDVRYVKE